MDIRPLRYFITVVEEKTFTAAATKLHISQPSLSTAIKKLEQNIGLTLLDRSTRKLRVTKEGELVYNEAKKLLTHASYVADEMKRLKMQGPLALSIGLIESSKFWIPKVFPSFREQFQDVRIKLLEILSLEEVENALTHFDIHIAITNQYIQNKEIAIIPIYEERLVALLPPNHPLQHDESITLKDVVNEDFIISKEGFQTREDILHAFRKQGMTPNIQFEIERFETACSLVEDGLGITFLPENYVRYSKNQSYHIKEIRHADISRPVYLAFVKNRYVPPIVQSFIALVKEFFQENKAT